MRAHEYPGKFIVIEGIDGSGKTTLAKNIERYLLDQGKEVLLTHEPTDGPIGSLIRSMLRRETPAAPVDALQYLYVADRLQHVAGMIEPALNKGAWVICDRYHYSTMAYGAATGVDQEVTAPPKFLLKPDVALYVRVSVSTAVARITQRGQQREYFEKENLLRSISQAYDALIQDHALVVIDGEGSPEQNFSQALQYVNV
jgi:dTMP kinase